MYKGTRKFDREQLVFMVDVILCSAMDRIGSSLPDEVPLDEYYEHEKEIEAWINSAIETAGMGMAVLCAQLTGEGLGIGDALDIIGFDMFVRDFKIERLNPNWEGLKAGELHTPDCRSLAEKFVNEVFKEYLED